LFGVPRRFTSFRRTFRRLGILNFGLDQGFLCDRWFPLFGPFGPFRVAKILVLSLFVSGYNGLNACAMGFSCFDVASPPSTPA